MTNLNDLMKEAQKMQKRMEEAQTALTKMQIEGTSGAGLVKVKMNGAHYIDKVELGASLEEEDLSMIGDLVAAAVNDAVSKVEKASKQKINELASGFNLPGGLLDKEGKE